MLLLKNRYLTIIKEICNGVFQKSGIRIILFGSRSRGNARDASDIDLAVVSDSPVRKEISILREQLEESVLPYSIDIVEFSDVTKTFQKKIEQEGILIWKN